MTLIIPANKRDFTKDSKFAEDLSANVDTKIAAKNKYARKPLLRP